MSYDNTQGLGADTWRHVAFIEQSAVRVREPDEPGPPGKGIRWLMSSDVCKHCTEAACLDVMDAAEALTALGAAAAAFAQRSPLLARLGGGALLAGSALASFGVFQAGVASARDPKYTVVPQRERKANAQRQPCRVRTLAS